MCNIYTQSQLERLSDKELCALFNLLTQQLYSEPADEQNTLTSLDNVRRVIARRKALPKPPGF